MKLVVAMAVFCFAVCVSTATNAQDRQAASQIVIPNNAIDQNCEIVLEKSKSASTETNTGKITRFDDKSVVLVEVTRTVRVESSVPILGNIPYLGRLFRNIGIATEEVPGEVTIDRNQIRSIKFAK